MRPRTLFLLVIGLVVALGALDARHPATTASVSAAAPELSTTVNLQVKSDAFVSVITWCQYDLLVQQARDALLPTATDLDVAVIAASPLHGGLLGSKRDHWKQQGRFADLFDRLERLEELLDGHDLNIVDTGLRYLLSDPRVSVILSGADSIEELERSVAVSDGVSLDTELIRQIESL